MGYRSRMPIVQVTALRQRVGVDVDVVSRRSPSRWPGARRGSIWHVGHLADAQPGATARARTTRRPSSRSAPTRRSCASAPSRGERRGDRARSLRRGGNGRPRARPRAGNAFVVWDECRRDGSHRRRDARHVGTRIARGSRARRQGRDRHRLESRDRPRDRHAPRRRGRRRLSARAGQTSSTQLSRRRARARGTASSRTSRRRRARPRWWQRRVEHFGGLDIVVNNVGGSGARTFDDMDEADLRAVLGKNLFPP